MSTSSRDMLCRALEMAEAAVELYGQTVDACPASLHRTIFEMLRDDSVAHRDRIRAIYEGLSKGETWDAVCALPPEGSPEEAEGERFRTLVRQFKDDRRCEASELEALAKAIDMERAMLSFYERKARQAKDAVEKAFLNRMVEEVRGHHRMLTDLHYYYENPEGWFMETERITLDD